MRGGDGGMLGGWEAPTWQVGGGMCGRGGSCVAGETATAADCTHLTGMHSCLKIKCSKGNYLLARDSLSHFPDSYYFLPLIHRYK